MKKKTVKKKVVKNKSVTPTRHPLTGSWVWPKGTRREVIEKWLCCQPQRRDEPEVDGKKEMIELVVKTLAALGWTPPQPVAASCDQAGPSRVQQFSTGAVRSKDRANERYDLMSPIALRRYAETCREGSARYGDYNWERGMPIKDMLNHAIAHILSYLAGDRSEDHLAHAFWNLAGAMHSEEQWPELNEMLRGNGTVPACNVRRVLDEIKKELVS